VLTLTVSASKLMETFYFLCIVLNCGPGVHSSSGSQDAYYRLDQLHLLTFSTLQYVTVRVNEKKHRRLVFPHNVFSIKILLEVITSYHT